MSKSLGISDVAENGLKSDIFISLHPTKEVPGIVIATGQGVLPRGTVLGKKEADSKHYIWDDNAEDGTENVVGILGCEVDTTTTDAIGFVYVSGEFNKAALNAGANEVPAGVYNYGSIVIKEEIE